MGSKHIKVDSMILFSTITSIFTMVLFIMQTETNMTINNLKNELYICNQNINTLTAQLADIQYMAKNTDTSTEQPPFGFEYPDTCNNIFSGQSCPMPAWTSNTEDVKYASVYIKGNTYIDGNIYVDSGSVNILTSDGRNSISDIVSVLSRVTYNTDCGIDYCVNGIQNGFDCTCVCFEGFTGQYCNSIVCENGTIGTDGLCNCPSNYMYDKLLGCITPICVYGRYDTLKQLCICNDGYIGDRCETPDVGTCEFCDCGSEIYGDECQYNCTAAAVLENKCFLDVYNYGQDSCQQYNDSWVCLCGGGYTYYENIIVTTVIYGYVGVDSPMYLLCGPRSYMNTYYQCQTQSCCETVPSDACVLYGCLSNSSGCYYPSTNIFTPYGGIYWTNIVTDCSNYSVLADWEVTKCSSILSRYIYLNIYDTQITLQNARYEVNLKQWNELSTLLVRLSGIQYVFNNVSLISNMIQGTPYTVVGTNRDNEPELVFTLQIYIRNTVFETGGYSITYLYNGQTYCIASYTDYVQGMLRYYGINTPTVVGINIDTYYTNSRQAYYDICAKFSSVDILDYYFVDTQTNMYLYIYNINSVPYIAWTNTTTQLTVNTIG